MPRRPKPEAERGERGKRRCRQCGQLSGTVNRRCPRCGIEFARPVEPVSPTQVEELIGLQDKVLAQSGGLQSALWLVHCCQRLYEIWGSWERVAIGLRNQAERQHHQHRPTPEEIAEAQETLRRHQAAQGATAVVAGAGRTEPWRLTEQEARERERRQEERRREENREAVEGQDEGDLPATAG